MPEEKDVIEESQASSDSSSEEQEQSSADEAQQSLEDVTTQELDSEAKAKEVADNYRKALKAERDRRKQAEERLRSASERAPREPREPREPRDERPAVELDGEEDIANRFYRTEANAYLARKMAEDPTFRERVDLVIQEMEGNSRLTAEQADERVKVRLFDQMLQSPEGSTEETTTVNQQIIKPSAIPEPQTPVVSSDNSLDDVIEGKTDFEDAKELGAALKKFRA